MARQRKPLPACFEESEDGKTAKCTICAPSLSNPSKLWILRKNAATHIASVEHSNAYAARQREEGLARAKARQQEMLAQSFVQFHDVPMAQSTSRYLQDHGTHLDMVEERMWEDYRLHGADFDTGDDPEVALARAQAALEQECDHFVYWDPEVARAEPGFGSKSYIDEIARASAEADIEAAEEEGLLADILNDEADINNMDPIDRQDEASSTRSKWFPYASQTEFMLDFIDRLPRIRIPDSLMKIFLWLLRETGARDVPSFYRLRKVQKTIRAESSIPTIKCESVRHNIFYMNDPRVVIAKDWANPLTRPHIHVYPEISDDGVSEAWHSQKWLRDVDLDALSPMYDAGGKHYYVNELTRLQNGNYIIPVRWVIYKKTVHAESQLVTINEENIAMLHATTPLQMISAAVLQDNYYDLEAKQLLPDAWDTASYLLQPECAHPHTLPNPLRELANGLPMYTSFIDYFGDDVSGNRSKSWNKHWNAYISHRNLPRELLQQEYHMHFISTSPHATVGEQFGEFKNAVESTHTSPVRMRDASTGKAACFRLFVHAKTSDNPMQSEASSHIGGNGNLFCRKCTVGGTNEEKESTKGFASLFQPGAPRSKEMIRACIHNQIALACRGVAQPIKDVQTATGIKDAYTQYWIDHLLLRAKEMAEQELPKRSIKEIEAELLAWVLEHEADIYSGFLTLKGFDPAKDTPVEILHTILLGLVKYGWHITHTQWNTTQKATYALRLQGTFTDGLSIHAIRANYIMQYANSLIGRQLKTLAQTTIFHVYDLVSPLQLQLWRTVGELSALLWFPEISDMSVYLNDIDIAVANVLDTWAEIDPSKLLQKIKLHLQTHVREDIIRFGPLVGVCTEGFESFNAVFRHCSVLSNHLAPSRDIAIQLADQEGLKHRLSGGWWQTSNGNWVSAGCGVQEMSRKHPMMQRLVGWTTPEASRPGDTKPEPIPRGKTRIWFELKSTTAAKAVNYGSYLPSSRWSAARVCIAESRDKCTVGSWVFFRSPTDNTEPLCGSITQILIQERSSSAIAVIDVLSLVSSRHSVFGMPCLQRRQGEKLFMIVPITNIRFNFNVQHDCAYAGCSASGKRARMQERCASGILEEFIEHVHDPATDRFIVNMHSFHNPHLLRAVIPRSLSAPQLLHQNRTEKHAEFSANLRRAQNAKREAQKKKREAEKARKAGLQKDVVINANTRQEHSGAHGGHCDEPEGAPPKRKRVD